MPITKEKKKVLVEDVAKALKGAKSVVFANFTS